MPKLSKTGNLTESKILELIRIIQEHGIDKGLGDGVFDKKKKVFVHKPGFMCVEQLIEYVIEGNTDGPSDMPYCVVDGASFGKTIINDRYWKSKKSRGEGLLKVAIAQLGSASVRNASDKFEKILDKIIEREMRLYLKKETVDLYLGTNRKPYPARDRLDMESESLNWIIKARHLKAEEGSRYLADLMLEALQELKSPGCEYLYLLEQK